MQHRPVTDVWLLARSQVNYYGAYPFGFLERARSLLGVTINDPVLHVCSGKLRSYPYRGLGANDKLVDADPSMSPDFVCDVRTQLPPGEWSAILADPPYSDGDAAHYGPGAALYPEPNALLKLCLENVRVGGRVGMLHYFAPRPPKKVGDSPIKLTALVAVLIGYKNRLRCLSVFERMEPKQANGAVVMPPWQYSRNQLRHWVTDGEVYPEGEDFHDLWEIKSNRTPSAIRKPTDTFTLLYRGKLVDSHKSVKFLKIVAESITARQHNVSSSPTAGGDGPCYQQKTEP